jgi:hypothetical protein
VALVRTDVSEEPGASFIRVTKIGELGTTQAARMQRMLSKVYGSKRDEVTGRWRKLHNEEFNEVYSSPSIIRTLKSRRRRWAIHVARMEEKGNVYKLLI